MAAVAKRNDSRQWGGEGDAKAVPGIDGRRRAAATTPTDEVPEAPGGDICRQDFDRQRVRETARGKLRSDLAAQRVASAAFEVSRGHERG